LLQLFASKSVVELATIRAALGNVSIMTAFRHLRGLAYRRSYNKNGRYYCLHEPSRYDRLGLWSFGDIHFSVDGSLKNTVRRMVHEAEAGATHRELADRLRVRVQNTLLDLLRHGEVDRERFAEVYVDLHTEPAVRKRQVKRRKERVASHDAAELSDVDLSDHDVIQVLLVLIRHPGSKPTEVRRRLRGHSPPLSLPQVQAVFSRYQLGEKGGSSSF
jgi:hypothetical protein